MKKIYIVALIAAISGLAIAEAGITITEKRLANADSEITVNNTIRKIKKIYKINMSDHHSPATSPDDPLVRKYKSWKFVAFMHFNCNTFSGTEYCSSKDPVKDFDPTALDVRQWVNTLKAAGMNYAALTVRHTGEFLLWDSATSQIKVTNSSYKKDLVAEYVDQCRKAGIAPGIYYCLWGGRWRPDPNARAVILAQLHELATNYGYIPYFFLDMPHHVGWLAKDLSQQEIYDSLKNVNSESVVMFNQGIGDAQTIKAFPTDVINGEMCSPPATGHQPYRIVDGRKYYLPYEYEPCSQQRGTHVYGTWDFPGASWFTYSSGKGFSPSKPLAADFLYRRIRTAYDRGASNVLISFAPDHTGLCRKGDIAQAVKLGRMIKNPSLAPELVTLGCKAISSPFWENDNEWSGGNAFDDDLTTRWASAAGTKSGWLEIDLGETKHFAKVTISEGWDRIRKFELQIKKDGRWQTIHKGTTIGADYRATFDPVTARHVKLNILEATDAPTIWEVGLFDEN